MTIQDIKVQISTAVMASAVIAAANTIFPTTSGDISDPEYWGGAIPSDAIELKGGTTAFAISRDVSFAGIFNNWGTLNITVDVGRTVTLNGNLWSATGLVNLNGGTYDVRGVYGFNTGAWNEWVWRSNAATFNGCVLTNMENVVLKNNGQPGLTWRMSGNAAIYTSGPFRLAAYGALVDDGQAFLMSSGAKVVCSRLQTDCGKNGSDIVYRRAELHLSGSGTSFTATGNEANMIGDRYSGARLIVDDFAHLNLTNGLTYLGAEAVSVSNVVSVSNHATADFQNVYLGGYGSGCGSSRFEVLSDARVTTDAFYATGGNSKCRDNMIVISNATLSCRVFTNGGINNSGSNTTVRISGDHPQLISWGDHSLALSLCNSPKLIFDIPLAGYRSGIIPIRVENYSIWGDGTAAIEFNGVDEYQRALKGRQGRQRIPLIYAAQEIRLHDGFYESVNASLPQGCRFYYDGDSKCAVLEVKPICGFVCSIQ